MSVDPQALATRRRQLASEYKKMMQELADIKKRKAFEMIKLIGEHKTASKAELYYAITPDGQKEIELLMASKGLLELMRAAKTEIDIMNAESYNQY